MLSKFAVTYGGTASSGLVDIWNKQAPKRLRYKTANGFRKAVVIGTAKKKELDCGIFLDKE